MTFDQFLERKTADDIHWPGDCNVRSIERKSETDRCYVEPGGSHDKIRDRGTQEIITFVPRHKGINPYTCKSIIDKVKKSCY